MVQVAAYSDHWLPVGQAVPIARRRFNHPGLSAFQAELKLWPVPQRAPPTANL